MEKVTDEQFDVAVIGAGPSGMMAAIRAAQKGARVAIIDKKENPGTKLLMTGNGRCNLTMDENDILNLSQKYGRSGKFMFSCLTAFRPKAVREFFAGNGLETKIEKDGKIFPASDRSEDVLKKLTDAMKENGVTFLYESDVVEFVLEEKNISKLILKNRDIVARNYIIATGGKSYPETGSAGAGYEWAEKMGHSITSPKPILTPIKTKETWVEQLQGVSASSVVMTVRDKKKKISEEGDLMFAHFGLSGPLALNMSREIQKLKETTADGVPNQVRDDNNLKIIIDFKPRLNFEQLDEVIRRDFEKNRNIKLANCLKSLLSPKLLDFLLKHSGLDLEKYAARISKKERQQIVMLIKSLDMTMDGMFGFERAMATSGGVSIKDIDSKTMKSRIIKNLFFAGEIIDADGPTGGYNLQLCWSTGYVAGENASK